MLALEPDEGGTMNRRLTLAVAAITAAASLCGEVADAAVPRVVASKSVSGQFAVTAVNATVKRPTGLWVRLKGNVDTGSAVFACSRNFSVSSNSKEMTRAGLYPLRIRPARADSCNVTASVGGSGRVTVQILATR
jgi:hypothetical protein